MKFHGVIIPVLVCLSAAVLLTSSVAYGSDETPNIVVIMGDDIGWFNVGAYGHGVMGIETPNIDRIAKEGMMFTDHYAHPSCTAGRAAFITGQLPIRTGLTTIGTPGAALGIQKEDPTLAELLKPLGYASGQFGKNHLGDLDEFLPTNHGFDEFFGNLYHLNAEEEPEQLDYPEDPEFRKRWAPRGVIHSWADGRIEDTGPLTRKRMETIDEEFLHASVEFMESAVKADKSFFVWFCPTRMHIWTHLKPGSRYLAAKISSEEDVYGSGMMEHDGQVGRLLDKLEELGVDDNTIVIYTTDNGAEKFTWPDGGTTPFRGEKGGTFEGGVRVPCLIRWPGRIKPGSVVNGITAHEDFVQTLMAAAGAGDIKEKLLNGYKVGRREYRVHLDGYNQINLWLGKGPSKRKSVFYYDENTLRAIRVGPWKAHFSTKSGFFDVPKALPVPLLFNLRMDPFEEKDGLNSELMMAKKLWTMGPMQAMVAEHIKSFEKFPPRQKAATLSVQKVMDDIMNNAANVGK